MGKQQLGISLNTIYIIYILVPCPFLALSVLCKKSRRLSRFLDQIGMEKLSHQPSMVWVAVPSHVAHWVIWKVLVEVVFFVGYVIEKHQCGARDVVGPVARPGMSEVSKIPDLLRMGKTGLAGRCPPPWGRPKGQQLNIAARPRMRMIDNSIRNLLELLVVHVSAVSLTMIHVRRGQFQICRNRLHDLRIVPSPFQVHVRPELEHGNANFTLGTCIGIPRYVPPDSRCRTGRSGPENVLPHLALTSSGRPKHECPKQIRFLSDFCASSRSDPDSSGTICTGLVCEVWVSVLHLCLHQIIELGHLTEADIEY